MKKKLLIAGLFVAVMALGLCACGQQGGSSAASDAAASAASAASDAASATDAAVQEASDKLLESAKAAFGTIGDVFATETSDFTSTYDEKQYTCAFNFEDGWVRLVADLPDGMYDQLEEVFVTDDEKTKELLSSLPVTDCQVIAPSTPTQEEIDEMFVGKTGAEINELGLDFTNLVVNGEETDCNLTSFPFDYLITFDGAVPDENTEDVNAALADMTIKAAAIQGLSWSAIEG